MNSVQLNHSIAENLTGKKRIVIIGAGFGGLKLARSLKGKDVQVILIDKNNYHQFQPLLYQVASSGIEPNSIAFPLRKVFQNQDNILIRITDVLEVKTAENKIITGIGEIAYDILVVASGADTNYFGQKAIEEHSLAMKSISESMVLRNRILENFERTLSASDCDDACCYMNIAVVGGGATGVELAGAIAEMKKYVLPKDYPELDFSLMKVYLIEGNDRLLNALSEFASDKAKKFLENLGVNVILNTYVTDYNGTILTLKDGRTLLSKTLIWTAGIKGNRIKGFSDDTFSRELRMKVDEFNKVEGFENIYAIGDIALMTSEKSPRGHPQVAQVALQQARLLSENLMAGFAGKQMKPFYYKDLGTMATVGRNQAVVDIKGLNFGGFFGWMIWMFVHLMAIVGVKNRLLIFINWFWSYITYDQSLRLIMKTKEK